MHLVHCYVKKFYSFFTDINGCDLICIKEKETRSCYGSKEWQHRCKPFFQPMLIKYNTVCEVALSKLVF